MNELGLDVHLHARIFRTAGEWYADIDDELDPQPDNPLWYGSYTTQRAAVEAACARIAAMHLAHHTRPSRRAS